MPQTKVHDLLKAGSSYRQWGEQPDREKAEEVQALKAALDEEAKENWDNPAWHREVAATISSTLTYSYQFNFSTGPYFDTRNVGEFDDVEIVEEQDGVKVFFTARGGYIEESQPRRSRYKVPRDTMGFHVSEFEDKVRAGFSDSVDSVASQGRTALNTEANRRLFTVLNAAISVGAGNETAAGGALTKAMVDDALISVRDAIRPDPQGPVPVTIIGRAASVDLLTELTSNHTWGAGANFGLNESAAEEARRNGYIGTYKGANVVVLINYTDADGTSYVEDDSLWVLGGNAGVFVNYGGVRAKSWVENTSDYYHIRARQDIGVLVNQAQLVHKVSNTF